MACHVLSHLKPYEAHLLTYHHAMPPTTYYLNQKGWGVHTYSIHQPGQDTHAHTLLGMRRMTPLRPSGHGAKHHFDQHLGDRQEHTRARLCHLAWLSPTQILYSVMDRCLIIPTTLRGPQLGLSNSKGILCPWSGQIKTSQPYMLPQVSTIHNTTLNTQIKGRFHEDVPKNYKGSELFPN